MHKRINHTITTNPIKNLLNKNNITMEDLQGILSQIVAIRSKKRLVADRQTAIQKIAEKEHNVCIFFKTIEHYPRLRKYPIDYFHLPIGYRNRKKQLWCFVKKN